MRVLTILLNFLGTLPHHPLLSDETNDEDPLAPYATSQGLLAQQLLADPSKQVNFQIYLLCSKTFRWLNPDRFDPSSPFFGSLFDIVVLKSCFKKMQKMACCTKF